MSELRCGCCAKIAYSVSPARGWCTSCELEFQRVLVYLEAAARVLRYAVAKAR